jgi:hypothetical protein
MQKRLGEHRLPRASVRNQRNVAKKLGGILFHGKAFLTWDVLNNSNRPMGASCSIVKELI